MSVLLAHRYTDDMDPTGYHLSEKLDGVRAVWTGKTIMSRNGNAFAAPAWLLANLPTSIKLDGELWLGRGVFEQTMSIVSTHTPSDIGWRQMKYMVFDTPDRTAGTFETRYQMLAQLIEKINHPQIVLVPQTKCPNRAFFQKAFQMVLDNGGEGLMLRKPGSLYEERRSFTLLKAKRFFYEDAKVIGYSPGEGKNTDKMGALICLNKSGVQFKVGSGFTDAQRDNPPPIGSTIEFKYQELTNGKKPRFPSFIARKIL